MTKWERISTGNVSVRVGVVYIYIYMKAHDADMPIYIYLRLFFGLIKIWNIYYIEKWKWGDCELSILYFKFLKVFQNNKIKFFQFLNYYLSNILTIILFNIGVCNF